MSYAAGIPVAERAITVVLLGNPNTGKSTLFSAMAGIPTRVGNYPGVTVEEKLGRMAYRGHSIQLIDLPGTYSLAPKSPDEQIAVNVLRGQMPGVPAPQCVVVVADATNLERNLYLTSQTLELGIPTVIALTLCDVADEKGIALDIQKLSQRLGCAVVRVVASRREGIDLLCEKILAATGVPQPRPAGLDASLTAETPTHSPAASEAIARYQWIENVLEGIVQRNPPAIRSLNDSIDAVLTHRVWGTLLFAATMLAMFSSIFWLATP
ncbi:MAG: 50S ribosome-binding GTPase, partial [Planctomycetia bacterium]|nr:50S ribosome-binding GTPase [Planctomycetia bacterium]